MTAPAPTADAPAIRVAHLGKTYGGRQVLEDVSFEVGRGEIVALLGPNGAGKTTTVEIIEGYRRGDRGEVDVLGSAPAAARREHRARVGLMLQGGGGIDPRLTPREVIRLFARFHAEPRDPDELLELVGLSGTPARTRYRRLSGGERQRLALALALVGRPDVAILDEPTAGMDVEARAATRDVLDALRRDGAAVLLTSHDLADVERLADRIVVLDRGRVVAIDAPAELAAATSSLRFRLRTPLDAEAREALARLLGAAVSVVEDGAGGRYRVRGIAPVPGVVAAVASWCAERDLAIAELTTTGTLEERYLELVGGRNGGAATTEANRTGAGS